MAPGNNYLNGALALFPSTVFASLYAMGTCSPQLQLQNTVLVTSRSASSIEGFNTHEFPLEGPDKFSRNDTRASLVLCRNYFTYLQRVTSPFKSLYSLCIFVSTLEKIKGSGQFEIFKKSISFFFFVLNSNLKT